MDSTTDPACQTCGEASPARTRRNIWLLDCAALSQSRLGIFGRNDLDIDVLIYYVSSQKVTALAWRVILFL